MSKFKVKIISSGATSIMKSEEVRAALTEIASGIRARCGDGYSQDIHVGKTRANASVGTETRESIKDNMKNNTLVKAMGGGGK